jgi:hypothetical protein
MTSVFKKMNVKDQKTLTVLNHPSSFEGYIQDMKSTGQKIISTLGPAPVTWILIFVTSKNDVSRLMPRVNELMEEDAMLWFAYPKKSSKKFSSDLTRDDGWEPLGQHGWEGVRQVAIDEDWSALRFRRVEYIKEITRSATMAMTAEAKKRTSQK